MKFFTRSKEK